MTTHHSAHIDQRIYNCPRYYLCPPNDRWMRVSDRASPFVAFIGLREGFDPRMAATCFFLRVPSERVPDSSFVYICTAKHVADDLDCADWVIRANKKGGGFVLLEGMTQLCGEGARRWWSHPSDEAVDFAVFPLPAELHGVLDVNPLPIMALGTPQLLSDEDIGPGDAVYVLGLFRDVYGTSRNRPVLRFGNVAMMADEKIQFHGKFIDAHLIECRSIRGLSGSPVFVHPSVRSVVRRSVVPPKSTGGQDAEVIIQEDTAMLLGSIIGHWDDPDLKSIPGEEGVNVGIAAVVPAQKMLEVLNQPGLVQHRQDQEADAMQRHNRAVLD